ncbi:MAG: 3-oxoacyl-ACP reductase, partial [Candidatus Eremiobacteraeota bacterium]|nr:3-oxoacyl-ACP reductase [Candidatus Eremiobacteraeota bacterium]
PEMLEKFNPSFVVPGVVYLASENAPTGVVLAAAAGVFSTARIAQTSGVALDTATLDADAIAERWDEIADESKLLDFDGVGRQTKWFYDRATGQVP